MSVLLPVGVNLKHRSLVFAKPRKKEGDWTHYDPFMCHHTTGGPGLAVTTTRTDWIFAVGVLSIVLDFGMQ